MLTNTTERSRDRQATAILVGFGVAKLVLHLALSGRYGYHRDELYFIECGRRLAFGYVDHPPMIGWIAAVAEAGFDSSLFGLRVFAAVAGAVAVVLCGLFVRDLGGGRYAQVLAGAAMLLAPVYLRSGIMLDIVVFEPLFWTGAALLVLRLLGGADPRGWLLVGGVVGVGLLNKHTMGLWAVGLLVGLAASSARVHLRSVWPWLGVTLAAVIVAPNLVWQATHDWATVEFLRALHSGILASVPRYLFVLGQLLYVGPASAPLWITGLGWLLLSSRARPYRAFGLQFVVLFVIFAATQAKPYYLAAAYPVLFAAGATAIERWSTGRSGARTAIAGIVVAGGLPLAALSVPVLPVQRIDAALDTLVGGVVPPMALTHDLHDEFGWEEQVAAVARVYASLPEAQQATATIVAGNYGEASAINFFGPALGLPRAVSGHMTYYLWGPDPHRSEPVIAFGLPEAMLGAICDAPTEVTRAGHPLAVPVERDVPVYVCDRPRAPLAALWPQLRRYGHGTEAAELADHAESDRAGAP